MTRAEAPKTSQTILSEQRIASRGAWGHVAEPDHSRELSKAVRMVAARQPRLPRRLGAAIVAELVERGHAEERN